jgi:membrane protein DedA with SNARE-associated domain
MADLAVVMWAFLQQLVLFIPSALAFVPRGVSLKAQNEGLWYVLGLALVIGVARVLAGLILYRVSDWIHDKVYARRQSWLGIKRTRLERVHQKLN